MIYCQQCSQALPDGTLFCDRCGTARLGPMPPNPATVANPGPSPRIARAQQGAAAARMTMVPPTMEPPASTPPLEEPRARTADPADTGVVRAARPVSRDGRTPMVRLRLTNGAEYELRGKFDYIIGRRDAITGFLPDVDLAQWNGAECGVSRRHATVHVTAEGVFIEDLESRNQTIRNGYRLLPRQQYPLADGDEIKLGLLTMLVAIT